jgi:hypothetical protein
MGAGHGEEAQLRELIASQVKVGLGGAGDSGASQPRPRAAVSLRDQLPPNARNTDLQR